MKEKNEGNSKKKGKEIEKINYSLQEEE